MTCIGTWEYRSGGIHFGVRLPSDPLNPYALARLAEEIRFLHNLFHSDDYASWRDAVAKDAQAGYIAQAFDTCEYVIPLGETARQVKALLHADACNEHVMCDYCGACAMCGCMCNGGEQ